MLNSALHEHCLAVENALQRVDDVLTSPATTGETLNRFWGLQDQLYRLVDIASDEYDEAGEVLRTEHPRLLSDAHQLLSAVRELQLARNTAIATACATARQHVLRLEDIAQSRAVAATA